MNINSVNTDLYTNGLAGLMMPNQQGQQNFNPQELPENQQMDSFVPSMMSMDMTFPTSNYNANGMMVGQMEMIMPVDNAQNASTVSTDNSTSTDFMSALQDAFRANADSIQSTMDELGLTMEDLTDEENLTTLANAMNEGAEKIGVPTVDNLEEVISNLVDQINGTSSDATETSAVTTSSESASTGSGSSSEDSETTTEVVTINGVTYLETTTTENGVETTTRTVLSTEDTTV